MRQPLLAWVSAGKALMAHDERLVAAVVFRPSPDDRDAALATQLLVYARTVLPAHRPRGTRPPIPSPPCHRVPPLSLTHHKEGSIGSTRSLGRSDRIEIRKDSDIFAKMVEWGSRPCASSGEPDSKQLPNVHVMSFVPIRPMRCSPNWDSPIIRCVGQRRKVHPFTVYNLHFIRLSNGTIFMGHEMGFNFFPLPSVSGFPH